MSESDARNVKIIYSKRLEEKYSTNPVERPERVVLPALDLISNGYEFIEPFPASLQEISQVRGKEHIDQVKKKGFFEAASLAVGGAICAAEQALQGDAAFALIRPPGHHDAANRAWGMCYFNNMAIAIRNIQPRAKTALIIDIDLHYGDGTVSIFRW